MFAGPPCPYGPPGPPGPVDFVGPLENMVQMHVSASQMIMNYALD